MNRLSDLSLDTVRRTLDALEAALESYANVPIDVLYGPDLIEETSLRKLLTRLEKETEKVRKTVTNKERVELQRQRKQQS